MKLAKFYISAAFFLVLTIIKIAFPSFFSELSYGINTVFEMESRHTEIAVDFGQKTVRKLIGNEAKSKQHGIKCLAPERRNACVFADSIRKNYDNDEASGLSEKEKTDKIAAFADSQTEITDAPIPENVLLAVNEFGFEYTAPVEKIKSSGFGYRIHPISNELKFHYGTDFAANTGTPIKAFADGKIVAAGVSESYGKYMIIDHGYGYSTLYAHCSELCMSCGEVKMGDTVALVGETGLATGPHLHFEIRYNGNYLNPEFYL